MITAQQIRRFSKAAKPEIVAAFVRDWPIAEAAGINTKKRVIWFFTQIGIETGGLKTLEESLNYRTAAQIRKTWPTRFTLASAQAYVKNPRELANKVYNGRMGNRSGSDDGWNYRGGGPIQTTGRAGYRAMGFESNPDDLRDPDNAMKVAVKEWTKRGCNALADRDAETALRKAINGGTNGLEHSAGYFKAASAAFANYTPGGAGVGQVKEEPQPAPVPAPEPEPVAPQLPDVLPEDPKEREHRVKLIQQDLLNLKYPPGGIDGDPGKLTRSAISDFRRENGLTPGGHIDDELILALRKATGPRELAPERANATPAEVQEKVPEAAKANEAKEEAASGKSDAGKAKVVAGGGIIGGLTMFAEGVVARITPTAEFLAPVKSFAANIPDWGWALIVVGAAAIAYYFISRIQQSAGRAENAASEAVEESTVAFQDARRL